MLRGTACLLLGGICDRPMVTLDYISNHTFSAPWPPSFDVAFDYSKFLTSWQPFVRSAPCFGHYFWLGGAFLTFIPLQHVLKHGFELCFVLFCTCKAEKAHR